MAEEGLSKKLTDLHEAVVDELVRRVQSGTPAVTRDGTPIVTEDGIPVTVPTTTEDLRAALQLLKQNGITAPVRAGGKMDTLSRVAGKLNFQGISEKRKVVPLHPDRQSPSGESPPTPDLPQLG